MKHVPPPKSMDDIDDDARYVLSVRLDGRTLRRLDRAVVWIPGANRGVLVRDLVRMALDRLEPTLAAIVARWQRQVDEGALAFFMDHVDVTELPAFKGGEED